MFQKKITTRVKYMKDLNKGDGEIKIYDEGAEREIKVEENESLEYAQLIFESFHKKTSVLFDI